MSSRGVYAGFAASTATPAALARGVVSVERMPAPAVQQRAEAAGAEPYDNVRVLAALLGTVEQPDGSNHAPPITDWYWHWSAAWCAMTCSYGLAHGGFSDDGGETLNLTRLAGIAQTTAKGWAYVPYLREDWADAGRFLQAPAVGDLGVIFDESHVTTIAAINDDGTIVSFEGNYSNGLYRVTRWPDAYAGFCRPPWELLAPPAHDPEEDDMAKAALGVYDHGGSTWLTDGMIRRRTNDPFVYLNAGLAEHLGAFSDGQHGELLDRGDLVEVDTAGGIDLSAIADRVAAKVADLIADRLAS